MITLDSAFAIGSTHNVCEDYAIAGLSPIPHLIVSDGCSSSPQTDVGARILAHAAADTLYAFYNTPEMGAVVGYEALGYEIIDRAKSHARMQHLHPYCLDATLLLCFVIKNTAIFYMYGDGNFITIDGQGTIQYTEVEFDGSRPYYLSYWTNQGRSKEYMETIVTEENGLENKQTICVNNTGLPLFTRQRFDEPSRSSLKLDGSGILALTSDGVSQFKNIDSREIHPTYRTLLRMCEFKNTRGVFAKRRLQRFLKTEMKEGNTNLDDVSLAALAYGDEQCLMQPKMYRQ